jgi:hypothetical protein
MDPGRRTGPLSSAIGDAGQRDNGEIERVRALARLLDTALRIPGTEIGIGLDAVLGLVPGVGDIAGAALSGYIVLAAARLGAPKAVVGRMLLNIATDTVLGAVPVLGDLFDVGWKSNSRNAALLERHLADPRAARRASRGVMALAIAGVVALAVGAVVLVGAVVRAVLGLF